MYLSPYIIRFCIIIIKGQWTPLHIASQDGHNSVVETLMKYGADVNAVEEVSCFVQECTYHLTS